jgi:hypothetical protein
MSIVLQTDEIISYSLPGGGLSFTSQYTVDTPANRIRFTGTNYSITPWSSLLTANWFVNDNPNGIATTPIFHPNGWSYGYYNPSLTFTDVSSLTVTYVINNPAQRGDDLVTEIGDFAFVGCSEMKTATIPDSCVRIGDGAYMNCSALKGTIVLPTGMRSVGAGAFAGTEIAGIVIPHTVEEIGEYAVPEGANIILMAEDTSGDRIAPAFEQLVGCLTHMNTVFVPSASIMSRVLAVAPDVMIRTLTPPVAPINVVLDRQKGEVAWDQETGVFAAPAMSFVVRGGETEYADVCSPFRLPMNNVESVSVIARNVAGDSPATVAV